MAKIKEIFVPHSHDSADKVDSALEASQEGMRCLKLSFGFLMLTAADPDRDRVLHELRRPAR